ncbi:hypothetical protein [Streptomyces misionensis]|uniref:hypothetical protein n=1 Tax=Streptomyces misionensis TaxID=67331 RepID=UPI0033B96807
MTLNHGLPFLAAHSKRLPRQAGRGAAEQARALQVHEVPHSGAPSTTDAQVSPMHAPPQITTANFYNM